MMGHNYAREIFKLRMKRRRREQARLTKLDQPAKRIRSRVPKSK
jgi:hypothetical protein